jgi:hypothetical protein
MRDDGREEVINKQHLRAVICGWAPERIFVLSFTLLESNSLNDLFQVDRQACV